MTHASAALAPSPPGLLFLQIAVILGLAIGVGRLLARAQQPAVVAQMIAGVMLGPSLFGLLLPDWQNALFPRASIPVLSGLGQVGVAIYMFGVGFEIDFAFVKSHLRSAAAVGFGGVVFPLAVGALLGAYLVHDTRLFPPLAHPWVAVMFFAAAVAVTAFPVMAAIISERGLLGTAVADLCLVCGCFSDLAAWSLLALVLAALAGNMSGASVTLIGAVVYVLAVVFVVRPLLERVFARAEGDDHGMPWRDVVLMTVMFAGAWSTELIGIHAAFGTFVMGAAMPRIASLGSVQERLRPFVVAFLLPLYFTSSGLATRVDLLNNGSLIFLTLLIVFVACTSKGVVCAAAAKLTGRTTQQALAVGALMNARGLVELVILSIGLQHGVITPTLYAMMVVMTIVTTIAASPALRWIYGPLPLGSAPARVPVPAEPAREAAATVEV
jgi:Kef-type K+ transport system membrane component KefB